MKASSQWLGGAAVALALSITAIAQTAAIANPASKGFFKDISVHHI